MCIIGHPIKMEKMSMSF